MIRTTIIIYTLTRIVKLNNFQQIIFIWNGLFNTIVVIDLRSKADRWLLGCCFLSYIGLILPSHKIQTGLKTDRVRNNTNEVLNKMMDDYRDSEHGRDFVRSSITKDQRIQESQIESTAKEPIFRFGDFYKIS